MFVVRKKRTRVRTCWFGVPNGPAFSVPPAGSLGPGRPTPRSVIISHGAFKTDIAHTSLHIKVNEMRHAVIVAVPHISETAAGSGRHTPMLIIRELMALKT